MYVIGSKMIEGSDENFRLVWVRRLMWPRKNPEPGLKENKSQLNQNN